MTDWWSVQESGLVGAILGGGLGGGFGIFGGIGGSLATKGRARRAVIAIYLTLTVIGVAVAATGIVAVALGQPYHVWYPLILSGSIVSLLGAGLYPAIMARYRAAERRRLNAQELRRG